MKSQRSTGRRSRAEIKMKPQNLQMQKNWTRLSIWPLWRRNFLRSAPQGKPLSKNWQKWESNWVRFRKNLWMEGAKLSWEKDCSQTRKDRLRSGRSACEKMKKTWLEKEKLSWHNLNCRVWPTPNQSLPCPQTTNSNKKSWTLIKEIIIAYCQQPSQCFQRRANKCYAGNKKHLKRLWTSDCRKFRTKRLDWQDLRRI